MLCVFRSASLLLDAVDKVLQDLVEDFLGLAVFEEALEVAQAAAFEEVEATLVDVSLGSALEHVQESLSLLLHLQSAGDAVVLEDGASDLHQLHDFPLVDHPLVVDDQVGPRGFHLLVLALDLLLDLSSEHFRDLNPLAVVKLILDVGGQLLGLLELRLWNLGALLSGLGDGVFVLNLEQQGLDHLSQVGAVLVLLGWQEQREGKVAGHCLNVVGALMGSSLGDQLDRRLD